MDKIIMFFAFISIPLQFIAIEIAITIITLYNIYCIWFSDLKNPDNDDNVNMTSLWILTWIGITAIIVILLLLGFPPS